MHNWFECKIKYEKTAEEGKIVKVNEKIAETVAGGYKKIEKGVVNGYKKIERWRFFGFYGTRIIVQGFIRHEKRLERFACFNIRFDQTQRCGRF